MNRIGIIGGGISGLSVAYSLSRHVKNIEVFEKEHEVGGIMRSVKHKGYLFDIGPHGIHTNNEILLKKIEEIMDGELISYNKFAEIKYKNKYYNYPLKPLNVLLRMNPVFSIWAGLNLLYVKLKYKLVKPEDRNAEEWLENRFGRPLYRVFFKDYTMKIWGVKPTKLAASFAKHRIPTISIMDMIKKGLLRIQDPFDTGHSFAPQVYTVYYPSKGGIGEFPNKMASKIKNNGGRIHLSSEVSRVNLRSDSVVSVDCKVGKKHARKPVDTLISTIPLPELVRMITPKLDKETLEAAESISYRSLLVVCIIVKKSRVFKPLHIYFTNKIFHRLTELKNFGRHLFPKEETGLMAEITCDYDDEKWNSNQEELCKEVVNDITAEGFMKEGDVKDCFVIKVRYAYPRYGVGFEEALNKIYKRLKRIKNLYSFGRLGIFRYIDMDICMEQGFRMADELVKGKQKEGLDSFDIEKTLYI